MLFLCALLLLLAWPAPGTAGDPPGNHLTDTVGAKSDVDGTGDTVQMDGAVAAITVRNIRAGEGVVRIAVFASATSFAKRQDAAAGIALPAEDETIAWETPPLPAGDVAIAVYQDMNENGRLDTGWFGVPLEPYGFSGPTTPRRGPPPFDAARITLPAGSTIPITVDLTPHP